MHFCWCIYVLIFFYVLPTLVSISSSCFLWCKVKPYDFGTVINSSDSVNDRVGLESSLRSRSWTTAKYYIQISLNSQASVDLKRLAKYTLLESVFYFACWERAKLSELPHHPVASKESTRLTRDRSSTVEPADSTRLESQ